MKYENLELDIIEFSEIDVLENSDDLGPIEG